MTSEPRADAARLLRALLVALVLRAAWALYTQPAPVSDYAEYLDLARRFVAAGSYPPENYRFPGMVWFLAAVLWVGGGSVGACVGATVVLAAAGVLPVWWLGRTLLRDERAARLGAWAYALDPTFVAYSPVLASEHLLTPLVLAAVAAAARRGGGRRARVGLAAVALGLAALTRGEGLFYVAPCAVALVPAEGALRDRLRRAAPAWLGLCAGVAAVVLPWVLRNERVVGPGAGLSTSGGYAFYYARRHGPGLFYAPHTDDAGTPLEGLPPLEANRLGWRLGWALLLEDPWEQVAVRAAVHAIKLHAPSSYAVHFSTRAPELAPSGAWATAPRVERVVGPASAVALLGGCVALALAAMAALLPSVRRAAPPRAWAVLGAIVGANALCYAVIFHGDARYRYVAQAALCVPIGLVLARFGGDDPVARAEAR